MAGRAPALPRLGIVAGQGALPRLVAEAARRAGRDVFIVALEGQAERLTPAGFPHIWVRIGRAGSALQRLKREGIADLVLAGGVYRPTLRDLAPDLTTLRFFASLGLEALGDDGLLRAVRRRLEADGFQILGADRFLRDNLMREGTLTVRAASLRDQADILHGVHVARLLGQADVGQAVIVQQGIVLGVEAVEGTDQLIQRAGGLKRAGGGGVLVKAKKPQQDRDLDLPVIGVETVRQIARAGLVGIACEVGGVLVIDPAGVAELADREGLFVTGIVP